MKNTEATKRHRAEPGSANWWTVRHNGSWRVGCKHCERVVRLVLDGTMDGHWVHVR